MNSSTVPLLILVLAVVQGVSSTDWKQYYNTGCTGTVENSGSETDSAICVSQQGASVDFSSGSGGCQISIYNDDACADFAYSVGSGCQDFGGTGKSFLVLCGE